MNLFEGLKRYAEQFVPVGESEPISQEDLAMVSSAEVVASQYGLSVCFHMVGGGKTYIPVSRDSNAVVGDRVDLTKAKVLTLVKPSSGEKIQRMEI